MIDRDGGTHRVHRVDRLSLLLPQYLGDAGMREVHSPRDFSQRAALGARLLDEHVTALRPLDSGPRRFHKFSSERARYYCAAMFKPMTVSTEGHEVRGVVVRVIPVDVMNVELASRAGESASGTLVVYVLAIRHGYIVAAQNPLPVRAIDRHGILGLRTAKEELCPPPHGSAKKRDWDIINSALAMYQAEDLQDLHGWSDAKADQHYRQLEKTREKVHVRLDATR